MYINELEILKKKLSKDMFLKCEQIANNQIDLFDEKELLNILTEIYSTGDFSGTIPYSVLTAETQTPDEWISDRLCKLFNS